MDVNADNLALQLFVRLVQKSNISGMERNSDSLQSAARKAYRAADKFMLVKKDRTKGKVQLKQCSFEGDADSSTGRLTMNSGRKQLQDTIWKLEHRKPEWQIAEPNPIVFWPAFQGACQEILDSTGSADHNWVQCKLWELLESHT